MCAVEVASLWRAVQVAHRALRVAWTRQHPRRVGVCVASSAEAAFSSQTAGRAHNAARRTATRLSGVHCSVGALNLEVSAIIVCVCHTHAIIRDCVVRGRRDATLKYCYSIVRSVGLLIDSAVGTV